MFTITLQGTVEPNLSISFDPQVLGVITGPLGTLSSTMNELVKNIDDESIQKNAKRLSVDIRNDLYAIAGAVDKKSSKDAMVALSKAEEKLEKFAIIVGSV